MVLVPFFRSSSAVVVTLGIRFLPPLSGHDSKTFSFALQLQPLLLLHHFRSPQPSPFSSSKGLGERTGVLLSRVDFDCHSVQDVHVDI